MPKLSEWIKTLGLDLNVLDSDDPEPGGIFFLENGTVVFLRVVPTDRVRKVACFGYPEPDCVGFRSTRQVIVEKGNADSEFIRGHEIDTEAEYYRNEDRNEERAESESKLFRVSEMTGLSFFWEPM